MRRLPGVGCVPSRTQIVCLHEGKQGRSIDPVFIRTLLKTINPSWIRPWPGNNVIRAVDCGGRNELIAKLPSELKGCMSMGGHTTLMVWADLDDNIDDGEQLKTKFWEKAKENGIVENEFDQVVFIFAKDRLENWIEYLRSGTTDESRQGPRIKHGRDVAEAARQLAKRCASGLSEPRLPPSLAWSCQNWRSFVQRMRD